MSGAEPAPAVSIIIPAYNTARFIGEAIDSVLAQTFTDYEIIVINDGSQDTEELERVLAGYGERVIYLKQENRGSSAARNAGLRLARGRYVALLDSDDFWEPEYLAVHVEVLESDPSVDIVFPNARLFGETPHAGRTYMEVAPLEGEITFARLLGGKSYVWGGVTARREAFELVGGFDETLGTAEDLDVWLRVLRRGGRIVYHRRVLAHYRKRGGSHTSNPSVLYRNFLKLLGKIEQTGGLTEEERTIVEHSVCHANLMLSRHEAKQALLAGDVPTAVQRLSVAHGLAPSRSLAWVLTLLRVAPRLTSLAFRLRSRLVGP